MNDYLGFTVIAAIVTTFGTILGYFLKDLLFVYFFDSLREKNALKKISKKYKDPILLSASELLRRVNQYVRDYDALCKISTAEILFDKTEKMTTNYADDPYFLRYKLVSTLYRFCAFFGWLELYRQEITFLDSHSKSDSSKVLAIIGTIRVSIADGQINTNSDWHLWKDPLIFREELRAIGEGMIEIKKEQNTILGYNKFQILINEFESKKSPLWLYPAINFFIGLQPLKDFRIERFRKLQTGLIDLIKCLDKEFYEKRKDSYV